MPRKTQTDSGNPQLETNLHSEGKAKVQVDERRELRRRGLVEGGSESRGRRESIGPRIKGAERKRGGLSCWRSRRARVDRWRIASRKDSFGRGERQLHVPRLDGVVSGKGSDRAQLLEDCTGMLLDESLDNLGLDHLVDEGVVVLLKRLKIRRQEATMGLITSSLVVGQGGEISEVLPFLPKLIVQTVDVFRRNN